MKGEIFALSFHSFFRFRKLGQKNKIKKKMTRNAQEVLCCIIYFYKNYHLNGKNVIQKRRLGKLRKVV